MHAPAIQKPVSLFLNGNEYLLVFDFQAIYESEQAYGLPLITGLPLEHLVEPYVQLVVSMLYGALRRHHCKFTWERTKDLLSLGNVTKVWASLLDAWAQGLPEQNVETDGEEKPLPQLDLPAQKLWGNIWSHARGDLGLSEEEFWAFTPRQLDLLSKRFAMRQQWHELLNARLMAVVVNYSTYAPDPPVSPAQFMSSIEPAEREEIDDEVIAARIDALLGAVAIPGKPN